MPTKHRSYYQKKSSTAGNPRLYLLTLCAIMFVTTCAPLLVLADGIENGDFENGLNAWAEVGGALAAAPGAGGTASSAKLGPTAGKAKPTGGVYTAIIQSFNCGPEDKDCFIKFQYRSSAIAADEIAAVVIDGPSGLKLFPLVDRALFGTVQAQYPDCCDLNVAFIIVNPDGAAIAQDFRVDNAADKCDDLSFPVPSLFPRPLDECQLDPTCAPVVDAYADLASPLVLALDVPALSPAGLVVLMLLMVGLGWITICRNRRHAT